MADTDNHFNQMLKATPSVEATPMERMRAKQAGTSAEKRNAWEVVGEVLASPLAPAHLPFVFSGTGILLVLLLGISGALNNDNARKSSKVMLNNKQFTAAQRAAAPLASNTNPLQLSDGKALKPQFNFLEAKIALLESKIARLREDLETARSNNQTLSSRLTSVETRFGTITASINRKETFLPAEKTSKNSSKAKNLPALSALPPKTITPRNTNNDTPEFSQTRFAAFLGSNTNRVSLQNYREQLRAKYASLFKNLDIYLAQPEKGEKKYRLIVGPVNNIAIVTKICVV